jgi:hypothetical protein
VHIQLCTPSYQIMRGALSRDVRRINNLQCPYCAPRPGKYAGRMKKRPGLLQHPAEEVVDIAPRPRLAVENGVTIAAVYCGMMSCHCQIDFIFVSLPAVRQPDVRSDRCGRPHHARAREDVRSSRLSREVLRARAPIPCMDAPPCATASSDAAVFWIYC